MSCFLRLALFWVEICIFILLDWSRLGKLKDTAIKKPSKKEREKLAFLGFHVGEDLNM